MEPYPKTRNVSAAVLLIMAFFLFGIYIGKHNGAEIDKVMGISGKETAVATTADFGPFWKVWNTINEKYPSPEKTSDQDRVYGAISGLVESLNDPYSVFFDPDEAKSFEEEIAGNFSGVGMEVGIKDRVLTVIAPLKDTPAYRANIKSGDKILKIDNTMTSGISIEQAIKMMRGEKGTTVILSISREGRKDPIEMKIVRDTINIPTLDTELLKDGIFIIRLYSFSGNSPTLFLKAMKNFAESETVKRLWVFRGTPGGI